MPSMEWSQLNRNQLGHYAEYYAKMEFASYGYDVYTSEVDDHGVDFIAINLKNNKGYKVQVKSLLSSSYTFIKKGNIELDASYLVCLLHFIEGKLPKVYVIPATVWKDPKRPFVERNYNKSGQKSKPEWGINYSKRNLPILEKYSASNYFNKEK